MGFKITQAEVTCDKCGGVETVTSNVLPDGWTRVRKANNSTAILCTGDTEALNSFFDPPKTGDPVPAASSVPPPLS